MTLIIIYHFDDKINYSKALRAMQLYTEHRETDDDDMLWCLQHQPVYTIGPRGSWDSLADNPDAIPCVASDRGGQITYHGPGQWVFYTLFNLKRHSYSIKQLIEDLETWVITTLKHHQISAHRWPKRPGVYIQQQKIAQIGLRVSRGYCYHGLSVNIHADQSAFQQMNPCGYQDLRTVQLADCLPSVTMTGIKDDFLAYLPPKWQQQPISQQSVACWDTFWDNIYGSRRT